MEKESRPPVRAQGRPEPVALGIVAVFASLFCWLPGLVIPIIGLCTYPKDSRGRVLCWVGVALFVIVTVLCALTCS